MIFLLKNGRIFKSHKANLVHGLFFWFSAFLFLNNGERMILKKKGNKRGNGKDEKKEELSNTHF